MAGIQLHVEKALSKLVLETLTSIRKGADRHMSTALATIVLQNVRRVLKSPDFVRKFLYAVVDNPGFVSPVAAVDRSVQLKLPAEQAKLKDR